METPLIKALAKVEPLRLLDDRSELPTSGAVSVVVGGAVMAIPMEGLVDLAAERKRLSSELEESSEAIQKLNVRLQDPQFMGKAPEEVVERERERLRNYEERKARLEELLTQLSG
jgi:valyl-tRNA synthetase